MSVYGTLIVSSYTVQSFNRGQILDLSLHHFIFLTYEKYCEIKVCFGQGLIHRDLNNNTLYNTLMDKNIIFRKFFFLARYCDKVNCRNSSPVAQISQSAFSG